MQLIKLSVTNLLLLAIVLILCFSTSNLKAQDQALMPAIPIPQPDQILAEPQLRILNAGLIRIGPSHAFEVTFEPYLWMGLDKNSNPIKYNYPKGSEIVEQTPAQKFIRYSRPLSIYAYIYLDYSKKPVESMKITMKKADEPQTIQLGLVQSNQRILPGIYRISIEIQINSQTPRNRDYIWVEESRLNLQNFVETKRVSPRRADLIRRTAIVVITNRENETYRSLRVGSVNYYSTALTKVKEISSMVESIDKMKMQKKDLLDNLRKNNEDPEESQEFRQLAFTIRKKELELYEAQFFQKNESKIKERLEIAKKEQEEFSKYVSEYDKHLRTACTEISEELREMYLEMWWVGNLCLPNWSPNEKFGTLEEVRKKWNISRFIDGPLDTEEVKGKWKKDKWKKWLEEEWLPKFDSIREKFKRFFGDQSLEEDDPWYYGVNENYQLTVWQPKNEIPYLAFKKIFSENLMETYGKALGNMLAYYHAEEKRKADFLFVDEDKKRATPGPLTANTYFNMMKIARDNFVKAFAPKQDPSERPDLSKVKKRKYYVSKNGLYIGPLEYDPRTKEKNDGPYDESILNPKDQVGE